MDARRGAATAAALTLAGALVLCPAPALAQASDTGTTEVTIVAGPGWDQDGENNQTSARPAGGRMPQTGDPAAWTPFLLAGAAACAAGLAVTSRDHKGAHDDQE
uniref:hypothetical protein n=1 Tax=Parolsenella massiliensis TaxID=1871022 RepID=UPI0009353CB6|nr:hypothetical protein [Parolsenella massiliensis]